MTRNTLLVAPLLIAAAMTSGCLTAAKETYGGITGASGIYVPTEPRAADRELLADYTRFELGEVKDDFAGRVPPEFFEYLPDQFKLALAKAKLPSAAGGKTAVIRGTIVYYEDQRFVGVLLGPLEEVVARTQIVDKATGKVLASAVCVGRTDTRTTIGVKNKAEGLGRAFAALIAANYPKPVKDKADKEED